MDFCSGLDENGSILTCCARGEGPKSLNETDQEPRARRQSYVLKAENLRYMTGYRPPVVADLLSDPQRGDSWLWKIKNRPSCFRPAGAINGAGDTM